MANEINNNKTSEVDGQLVDQQVNDDAAAKEGNITEEANSQATENKEYHNNTEEEMNKSLNSMAESNGTGTVGTESKSRTVKTGKAKVFPIGNGIPHGTDGFEVIGQENYVIASDLDKYERDKNLQAAQYERIAAVIEAEATKQIDEGRESIIGHPSESEVYSLIGNTTEKTVTNETTKEPIQSPLHRTIGTKFKSFATMFNNSGDYVANLHDVDKQFANKPSGDLTHKTYGSALVFNRLNADGRVIPNKMIMPKIGKYLLLGINPFGATTNAANLVKIGNTVNKQNLITGKKAEVEYYQSTIGSNNNLFNVIDVTSIYENITNATKETIDTLVCEKSKMQFGLYEKIADILQEVKTMTPSDDSDASRMQEWYYEGNRSTLWRGEVSYAINGSTNYTIACQNSPAQFVRFMEGLRSSETVWAMAGLNMINGTDSVLWGKGQTGKTKDPFFRQFSGFCFKTDKLGHYTDNLSTSIKLPNMVPYMRSLMSARSFQRGGNIAYQVKELQSKITAMRTLLMENASMKSLLEKVGMMDETVKQLNNALSHGRVVTDEGMNSNAIIKLPDTIDIILDFDPNDLVQCVVSADAPYDIKWKPAAGYVNLKLDDNVNTGPKNTFYVLPTWIDSLLEYFNTCDEWRKVVCYNLTSADVQWYEAWDEFETFANKSWNSGNDNKQTYTKARSLLYWLFANWNVSSKVFDGATAKWGPDGEAIKRYIPIQVNSFTGNLWAYLLLDSFLLCANVTFGANQNKNAFLKRYLPFLDSNSLIKETLGLYWDKNAYDFIKESLTNEAFKVNPKAQTPNKYPMLFGEAREYFLGKLDNYIATIKTTYYDNEGTNEESDTTLACYQPTKFLRRKQNTKGLSFYALDNNDGNKISKGIFPFNTLLSRFNGLIGPGAIHAQLIVPTRLKTLNVADDVVSPAEGVVSNFNIYKNLFVKLGSDNEGIKEMENTIKRTNFNADDEYLHYTDDYGKELYGKDHFLVPNSDYLIPAADDGIYADASKPDYFDYSDVMLLPADEIEDQPTSNIAARLAREPLVHGKINAVTEQVEIGEETVTITRNNPCPGYTVDNSLAAKVAFRRLTRSSLYGYVREAVFGVVTLTPDLIHRQGLKRTVTQNVSGNTNKLPAQYSNIIFGFLPEIYGVECVDHEWQYTTAPMDDLEAAAGDAKYYYRQNGFVGDPDNSYTGDATEYGITKFYDLGNWVINCFILSKIKNGSLLEIPRIIDININDFRSKLLDYYHIASEVECPISEKAADLRVDYIHMDPDFIYGDDVLSRYNFNDITTYKVGQPTVSLNKLWKLHSNFKALLHEQYVKGK